MSNYHETWWKWLSHEVIIFTKFHKDWITIVDFLLLANFWTCPVFFLLRLYLWNIIVIKIFWMWNNQCASSGYYAVYLAFSSQTCSIKNPTTVALWSAVWNLFLKIMVKIFFFVCIYDISIVDFDLGALCSNLGKTKCLINVIYSM